MNSWPVPPTLLISLGLFLSCAIFAPTAISAEETAENLARSLNCTAVRCPSNMICIQKRILCAQDPCRSASVPYCELDPDVNSVRFDDFTCDSVKCPETHVCVMKDKCEKGPCPLMPSCEPMMVNDGC